jgi:hypothetical protein
MRYLALYILLFFILTLNLKSQDKVIKGDTLYDYNRDKAMIEKIELEDFLKSEDDFNFRFRNFGQVVEIKKNNDSLSGQLTNYIFKLKTRGYKRTDTLYNKVALTPSEASNAWNIIQASDILTLESMDMIKEWSGGCDGITYTIEHSDSNDYWYKSYWTPSVQDSIPESIIVMNFVRDISDTLNLTDRYKTFKKSLPHKGCYNSGGMFVTCYVGNSYGVGYRGSTKLPTGLYGSLNLAYIGKVHTDFGLNAHYQFDKKDNYDFRINLSKGKIAVRNSFIRNDFLSYTFRQRQLDFVTKDITFINHKALYGLSLKHHFDIGIGADYLIESKNKIGGILYAYKWITKLKLGISAKSSIFSDELDYNFGISRSIHFRNPLFIRSASVGIEFENFKDYDELILNLTLWF